jgi:hypothetical protein
MRSTRFELHIVPIVRQLDRSHMQQFKSIDLWDYATVSKPAMASKILRALQAQPSDVMPPQSHGGPWPDEWIQLFQRWINEGFPRLSLGTSSQFSAQRNGPVVSVTADGPSAGANVTVWLDRYSGPQSADLVLYSDSVSQAGFAQSYPVTDYFSFSATMTQIQVLDAVGVHAVSIT